MTEQLKADGGASHMVSARTQFPHGDIENTYGDFY